MASKKTYDDNAITALKGADQVRKRPAVIFGSDGLEGCQHSVFEIISNAVDEAREGHGDKVEVNRFADGSFGVRDYGRGIPVGWNAAEQKDNWVLIFETLYAGGKYDSNEGGNYTFALGLNGLGLTATQMASKWMEAEIWKDGTYYKLRFENGNNVGGLSSAPCAKNKRGSYIHWLPDLAVFTRIDVDAAWFRETLKMQAIVNKGIRFFFYNEENLGAGETEEFFYQNGIVDYVKELSGTNALTEVQYWEAERKGRDRADMPDYKLKITAAVAFHRSETLKMYFHNASWLEHGGSPDKAAQSAFTSFFDGWFKAQGKYTKTDPRVKFQDIADCMLLVVSSFSTVTSYENQTKKAINNKFIQEAMTDFFKHQLEVYFLENKTDAERIAEQILINMRSRVKAEQTRISLKKTLQSGTGIQNRIEKFVDCRSRNVDEREIYIVEGDSALGSCKQARNSEFQAIMPVRGKILNCLKADYDKIFKNEIILNLVRVLGCGIAVQGKQNKEFASFDLKNLNWSKVIICTDADVDGFNIRTLILTMIYRLMPGLIEAGKVYIAESPLYEINSGGETWFCYTEGEKVQALRALEGKKYTIQRSKGLGENDADMMSLTTMHPKTRRLIKVCSADPVKTMEMFDLMEGDNLAGRKEHIALHGHEYIALADVS
ncbi:MAG: DNA topoisomerase [Oscillospiraceae bacterium]|jgi:DNA gyrase subunit B|nr:DNA topoisomerase [Oscillospiraceae bacterium]